VILGFPRNPRAGPRRLSSRRSSRGVTPDGLAAVWLVSAGAAVGGTAITIVVINTTRVAAERNNILVGDFSILVGDFSKQTLPDSVNLY
jgi:hypothetical protein